MNRKTVSGIVVFLLLMSIGMVGSVGAVNDYDIKIEVIPSSVLQGETVTFRIHADLVGFDDSILDYVSIQGYTAPDTAGIFVWISGTAYSWHYRNELCPIIIDNGVPSEASDYVDVTFGTNAPDKDDWEPPSTTDVAGLYVVDFSGYLYMTDGSKHWFNIYREFTVTPPGEEWTGYTPGWWGLNAAKLLGISRGSPQLTMGEYQAAVSCVRTRWSSDLPWLPTNVEGAWAIFNAGPKNDPVVKARIQLLAFLLTLCHFGEDFAPMPITGPLGTFTLSPAGWATFLITHYNLGHYSDVYYYADKLNNY